MGKAVLGYNGQWPGVCGSLQGFMRGAGGEAKANHSGQQQGEWLGRKGYPDHKGGDLQDAG